MKRIWLLFTLLFATTAYGDSVDKWIWNPTTRQFQAQIRGGITKPVTAAGGAAPGSICTFTTATATSYTVSDTDGCSVFITTTVSTTMAYTLPSAANNKGRTLTFKKVDAGTGKISNDSGGDGYD